MSFLLRKVGTTLLSLAGVTLIVTLFLNFIPGDPVEVMLGEQAGNVDRAALRRAIGLDRPVHEQVFRFVRDLATGELRTSLPPFKEKVLPKIAEKLPRTLVLAVVSMTLAILIAIPLGVFSAQRKGGVLDQGAMVFALLGVSIPRSALGPVLIVLFAIELGWLPALGDVDTRSLILPSLTLALALAAMLSRMTRSAMLDVNREDYVTTARAKGLPERTVVWRHVLRNALIPVITIVGLQFGALLVGGIVTEKVFNWPGMGTLLLQAVQQRDYNTVRACVLVFTFVYVVVNLLTDLTYALVDPRVPSEGRR
ncbi:MAG: ABC transporter permease [Deltaproteobacteria bacterium]|nr:MAG: ABC transporter permease [Deltaproteobacteria bacterium]